MAVSYARKYSSYGLPIDDLIHEGVLGIMHALEKFDTSKDLLENINQLNSDGLLNKINLVLNGVGNSQKYGYKYNYQYGYKYQYGYSYVEKD